MSSSAVQRRRAFSRRVLMRGLAISVLIVVTGVAFAATSAERPASDGDPAVLLKGSGVLQAKTSHHGRAVVKADDMVPGQKVTGKIKVTVEREARLRLRIDRVKRNPGPYGGVLAKALELRVKRLGTERGLGIVYDGRIKQVRRRPLGSWTAGESRRFRVRVRLPASAASQDDLQGARTGFRLVWRAG